MQVIFIHHSCFLVEVDEKVLIFDWFAGDRVNGYTFRGQIPEYEPDTPIYVFDLSVRELITYVSPCEKYQVDDLEIETLRSTDAGVAFYVKTNGASFYHAGDLNNWKWDGAGELVNGIMDVNYKNQIKKLAKKDINLAFVPFDPKLGMYQSLGMEYFLENTNAEYVFPMHMWQDYSGIQPFIKRLSNQAMADRIVPIVHENQVFEIREE